jgi:hypothetical protein
MGPAGVRVSIIILEYVVMLGDLHGTFNKEMICTDTRTYKFVVIEL